MSVTLHIAPALGPGFLRRLRAHAERIMSRPPDETIGDRYMRRWHVAKSQAWSYYVHLYAGDDPAPWPHDHPWPSLSLCLRGTLHEHARDRRGRSRGTTIAPGMLLWRPARFAHRLELTSSTALTLFLAGPHTRTWGWHLPGGWVPWNEISRVDPDGVTRVRPPAGREQTCAGLPSVPTRTPESP